MLLILEEKAPNFPLQATQTQSETHNGPGAHWSKLEKMVLKCDPHTPDTLRAQVTTVPLCHSIRQHNACLGKDWSGKGWENQHPNLSLQLHTPSSHR